MRAKSLGLLGAVSALLFAAAPASAIDLIDPARLDPNPVQTISARADTLAQDSISFDDLTKGALGADEQFHEQELHVHAHSDGGNPSNDQPTSAALTDTQQTLDWCRWRAFTSTADALQQNASIDVYATLQSDLETCLDNHFDDQSTDRWVSIALAIDNETQLLTIVNPSLGYPAAHDQVVNVGLTLPTQVWIDWFRASAAEVPPV